MGRTSPKHRHPVVDEIDAGLGGKPCTRYGASPLAHPNSIRSAKFVKSEGVVRDPGSCINRKISNPSRPANGPSATTERSQP
jgi:hypothetical protein